MPTRLTVLYQVGDLVEVLFQDEVAAEWHAGRVIALQHPGLWVRTGDGGLWFVTNGRRIRRQDDDLPGRTAPVVGSG